MPFLKENQLKISACLVVYRGEKLIEGLLENIKDLIDEIILVYDGETEKEIDQTLEIAERFCKKANLPLKIFKRPHRGNAELHRPFSFFQASGNWILWIDADERFIGSSSELKEFLRTHPTITRIRFLLGTPKELRRNVALYRPRLFKKEANAFFGIPHEKPILLKGESYDYPATIKIIHLEERRPFKELIKKAIKWSKIYAETFFMPLEKIEKFNTNPFIEEQFEIKRQRKKKWAIFLIFPVTCFTFFSTLIRRKNFPITFSVSLFVFLSYFRLIVGQLRKKFKKLGFL